MTTLHSITSGIRHEGIPLLTQELIERLSMNREDGDMLVEGIIVEAWMETITSAYHTQPKECPVALFEIRDHGRFIAYLDDKDWGRVADDIDSLAGNSWGAIPDSCITARL